MKGMVRRGGGKGRDVTEWNIVIAQLTKATGGAKERPLLRKAWFSWLCHHRTRPAWFSEQYKVRLRLLMVG